MDINEMIMKGKNAKNVDELKTMAAQKGWNMCDDEAQAYFEEIQRFSANNQSSELSDDELDNVSGGGCHTKVCGCAIIPRT